ncbi:MAG: prolyl aminopeptidase, partial [Pseudomonadota bacterium]
EFDGQILAHAGRIKHIPGTIVQGRYDMICPPDSAYALSQAWPAGQLKMVRNAGHALSEPGISAELVRTMDRIAGK